MAAHPQALRLLGADEPALRGRKRQQFRPWVHACPHPTSLRTQAAPEPTAGTICGCRQDGAAECRVLTAPGSTVLAESAHDAVDRRGDGAEGGSDDVRVHAHAPRDLAG